MRSTKYIPLLIIGIMLTTIGCFEQTKKVTSAAESMKKNRVVRIITDAVNAPFEFGKDTGVQGLDVDIGNEIGKTLGIEVKWVKVSGYEHLFELLKNGDAEILISSIAIDSKKAAEFSFSTPYYDSGDGIAVQHGKLDINDPASLSAKKVGVATERPGDAFMSLQKAVSVKKYDTLDDAMGGLNRAEIDAVVGDEPFIAYGSVKSFLNTMLLPTMINKYQYAVVIRKSEPDLLATINETINRLKTSGDLKKLDEKWMGNARAEAAKRHNKVVKMHNDEIELRRAENAPKTISVNIIKLSGSWDMSRLDGFELVLKGASETFQSTPIETTGNKGNCKFIRQVPPGDYMLNLNILKMEAKVSVPALAKPSLTMDMKIAQELTIQFK